MKIYTNVGALKPVLWVVSYYKNVMAAFCCEKNKVENIKLTGHVLCVVNTKLC